MPYEYTGVMKATSHRRWLAAAARRSLTPEQALAHIKALAATFGVPVPQVQFRNMRGGTYYRPSMTRPPRIHLPAASRRWGGQLDLGITLHEFAHHLCWHKGGPNPARHRSHGPEFVAWLDRLLEEFYS